MRPTEKINNRNRTRSDPCFAQYIKHGLKSNHSYLFKKCRKKVRQKMQEDSKQRETKTEKNVINFPVKCNSQCSHIHREY